jgi:DNA topoisomerase-1
MNLLVLESPNKVKDVKKYADSLGFTCSVIATAGHLLDLPPMAEGPSIDISTMAPSKLQPRDQRAAEQCSRIKDAIQRASCVIVATDPDREGEAIAAQVWPWIPKGKAWRATFEEITQEGVKRGLAAMQPHLHQSAADAALARRVIDRLAGWHATSVVFDKLRQHKGVSAGRLQSAALRLVVERYRENTSFVPSSTYGVRLRLRTGEGAEFTAKLLGTDNAPRVFNTRAEAEAFPKPGSGTVREISATEKHQRPKPPFEATSWLQVAQKALGLSVKDATAAIQNLFESGHTTYPRTDTVRVSSEAIEWAREEISQRLGPAYLPAEPWQHKDRGSSIVQGAHEAIRPTIPHDPSELDCRQEGQWARAYRLIEARFLASQAAARIVQQTTASIDACGSIYQAVGQVELFAGWKKLLATDAEEEPENPKDGKEETDITGTLPRLVQGQSLHVVACEVVTITTKPKPLFTQAGLVAELKRLGIGRPSTYPTIVPLLLSRGWVVEKAPKKKTKSAEAPSALVPEPVAFELTDFLTTAFPSLVDYRFTASMEEKLDEIEAQKASRLAVAFTWWTRFEQELAAARASKPHLRERPDLGPCPKCASEGRPGHLRLIQGVKDDKPYEFAGCDQDTKTNRICGFTAPTEKGALIQILPCPCCGAKLRPVRRRDGGHSWACSTCPDNKWFLADQAWQIVQSPTCEKCLKPMTHRERTNPKGEFFWACFPCNTFRDSDVFGALVPPVRGSRREFSAQPTR